ncbi:hypothetical protein [Croceimicrobium hydrocarbonivorans]|uniref:Uncharacterized protein n=1 Tax=Croceimicrobium hydrocarbonivorans TaxID=2761580 RepID=A0A7H0VIW7_9FLAO|nr:hypothetical protein [Croceimicrobium hydrocarbonivorans]QNR25665.1 hypothetical protein H4K34_07440 [Croceimicrobium hydrocarbonivorans]
MVKILRAIYWRFHILIEPFTADSESAKILGSSSLFTMATTFWFLSIYKGIAKHFMDRPLLDRPKVGVVFLLALLISIYISTTTKNGKEYSPYRNTKANRFLIPLLTVVYVLGAYITFFGFTLDS